MELDLAQLDRSANGSDLLRAEICIIGAGIAGLTLAHKLVALGHDVLVLESGGHAPEFFTAIEQAGHPHPGTSEPRPRAVGGTSLTWGGQLLPLPADAEWPLSAADIAALATEAEDLLGVDSLPYDAPEFFSRIGEPSPAVLAQVPELTGTLSKFIPFSRRNLAQTLGRTLRTHSKARIAIHAHVTELIHASTGDHIEAVLVRTPDEAVHRVQAAQFVVAAGTIETVRLLLASQSARPGGIGNEHDQVGRNFHDHLTVTAAAVGEPARTQLLAAMRPWIYQGTFHSLKLSASRQLQ
ncbi:MAG TPA: FAD-dependent oxidoreductase, partial [Acidobacteriaceae bacterium]